MTSNRSLDEFAAGSGEEAAGAEAEPAAASPAEEPSPEAAGEPAAEQPATDSADEEPVEPVESTYHWTPGGGPCAVCGASAEERWRQGSGLVCPDCKEW